MTKEERDNAIQRELKIITALDAIENATREIRTQLMYLTDEVCKATRKDEPSNSEKPNNCEECKHWNDTEDGCADRHGCKDEPTISKMEQVETMSCQECKRWIYDDRWGWFCPLKSQDECKYEPKDLEQFRVGLEYHTDTTHFGKVKGESITTNKVEDEPQTDCAWK